MLLTNSDAVYGSLGAIGVLFAVAVALIVARVLAPHRDVDDDEFDDARYGTTDQTVMVLGATGWIGVYSCLLLASTSMQLIPKTLGT